MHRGLHYLSNLSTANFEKARETVRNFINARSDAEIIFTRNATEAINLVASSYGGEHIGEGDEILLSIMEHHSNIVPWYFLKERKGAVLKWAPMSDDGEFAARQVRGADRPAHQDDRHHPYVERARHRRADQGGGARSRMRGASLCSSTARKARCTSPSMCRTSTSTSTPSPATSSTARPASACSTASRSFWRRCRLIRAAAR